MERGARPRGMDGTVSSRHRARSPRSPRGARNAVCNRDVREVRRTRTREPREVASQVTAERLTATVTLLFCDLVESTALASGLGDAAADALRRDVFDALRSEVTAHRGTEVKNLGDGLMVSFASNADAVRTACGMQQAIDVLPRKRQLPLALRVGISVGEATFEDDDWLGTPVIEASRLCSAASSGQVLAADVVRVLLGSRSETMLRPVGELALKGLPEPLAA